MDFNMMMAGQMKIPLISLVGLTSVGKTAFLRTFLRDPSLGEINAAAGTTCEPDDYTLWLNDRKEPLFVLSDTPGMQRLIGLGARMKEQFTNRAFDTFSIAEICETIPNGDDPAADSFCHDRPSWRKIHESDLLLTVLDVTENPSNSDSRDMIPFLTLCRKEKPVVVVLNKVGSAYEEISFRSEWEKILDDEKLRYLPYDAHDRDIDDESALFDTLADLIPSLGRKLEQIKNIRRNEEEKRREDALNDVARYLLQVARTKEFLGKRKGGQNRFESEEAEKQLFRDLAITEKKFVEKITSVWGFRPNVVADTGEFSDNVQYAHRVEVSLKRRRIAAGAAVGVSADLLFCGFSLGAGSLLGAAVGGALGWACDKAASSGSSSAKLVFFVPDIKYLETALDRSLGLYRALSRRGHAVPVSSPIKLKEMPLLDAPEAIEELQRQQASGTDLASGLVALPMTIFEKIQQFQDADYSERAARKIVDFLKKVPQES
ncbi:MAG: DUF3482 domain-containing protein [Thermoguttaceae bacterium]|jgi:GTPase SAR1 family protein